MMNKVSDKKIKHRGYIFGVEGDYLHIKKGNILLVRMCVSPVVDGKKFGISEWRKVDAGHLSGKVKGISASAHVKIDNGYVCFYLETAIGHFSRLHYFSDGLVNGDGWQTYLSDVNYFFRNY